MKNAKEKNMILGRVIEAEAKTGNPDMKLVRECTEKIEATSGKLTESEIEAKLASITGTKKKPTRFKIYKNGEFSVKNFVGVSTMTLGVGEGIFMIEE